MDTKSIATFLVVVIVLVATSSCLGPAGDPDVSIGEEGETSWSEALESGVVQPVEPGTDLTGAAHQFYDERVSLSDGESEFGLVHVNLIPDVVEVVDESGTAHLSLVMEFPDLIDRDPSFLGIGGWDFLYGGATDLSQMVIEFSILAPRGIRDLSLEVIDTNGKTRGWFMPEPETTWADYVIDPSKPAAQGKFTKYKGDSGFDIKKVVKIRLDETSRGSTFFRDVNPVTSSPVAWNAWNDLRVRPRTEVKPKLSCLKPLKEYLDNGTDCVYRRGPKNHFIVEMTLPAGATSPKLKITDPGKQIDVTSVTVKGPVVSGSKAVFQLEVPSGNPVGIYRVKGQATIGSAQVDSAALPVHIIFDVPPSMQADKAAVKAYLYDEAANRDEYSYHTGPYYSYYISKGTDSWRKSHPEQAYILTPTDKDLFARVIQAVHGETKEKEVADNLMWAVSNVIKYTNPQPNKNVPKILAGAISAAQFAKAYGPTGAETQQVGGQCLDYANMLAAVLRSAGIPARVATKKEASGYIYHEWTEAYVENPPSGTDKWYSYDAMDTGVDPVGSKSRAKNTFGPGGFEVVVGGKQWNMDGGVLQLKVTQTSPQKRIGLRHAGVNAKDAVFEKCDQKKYDASGCPDVDPEDPGLLAITLDKDQYRVGDTVIATVEVTNPSPDEQSFVLAFRFFVSDRADDGRTAYGDPLLDMEGSGVLGTTLFEAEETVRMPANDSAELRYELEVPQATLPRDVFAVEARLTGDDVEELERAGVPVAAGYDSEISLEPREPEIGKDLDATLRITNRMAVPLADLSVEMDVPKFFSPLGETTWGVSELEPGEEVEFSVKLAPVSARIPKLQHVRYLIRSENGGNLTEPLEVVLRRPPLPQIVPVDVPLTAIVEEEFEITYEVENIGDGTLEAASVSLVIPEETAAAEESLVKMIEELPPGESIPVTWTLRAETPGLILLSINVEDRTGAHFDERQDMIEVLES